MVEVRNAITNSVSVRLQLTEVRVSAAEALKQYSVIRQITHTHTHTHTCTAILVRTLVDIMHVLAPYPNLHPNLILTLKSPLKAEMSSLSKKCPHFHGVKLT